MNNRREKLYLILTLIFVILAPGPLMAQAFSFNVPIELKDINPKYTFATVECVVVDQNNKRIGAFKPGPLRLTRGQFSGILSVPVSPDASKSALDATRYACSISFCTSAQDTQCQPAKTAKNPELQHQPGSVYAPEVIGSIQ